MTERMADAHEKFRSEIRDLVKHIEREALREKPPRRIRFAESEIGSNIFVNKRFRDKQTRAVVAEEVNYDPSLFWGGPAGAFYAALWHEFGHGEGRYERMEHEDDRQYSEELKKYGKAAHDLLNVKYDIVLDSNNVADRPGIRTPYRALYDHYFPKSLSERRKEMRERAMESQIPEPLQETLQAVERVLRRPFKFLIALKHEAYWHVEDSRNKTPESPNPYIAEDPELNEPLERSREALVFVADAKRGTHRRHERWNQDIAPEYFALLGSQPEQLTKEIEQQLGAGKTTLGDLGKLADALGGSGEPQPAPGDAKEAAGRILDAIAKQPLPAEGVPGHADHVEVAIDGSDAHHPENPDSGKLYPPAPQEKKSDAKGKDEKKSEKKEKPSDKSETSKQSGATESNQSILERLRERGITPADHQEYRNIMQLIDAAALNDLINGLVVSFAEDRERAILKSQLVGSIPAARKSEALRRRYAGEVMPAVREMRQIIERFMGVDIIVANDHSGSMNGGKEQAAKAANAALAHAVRRVNSEIARRLRQRGIAAAEANRAPPVRYLGLLFSDRVLSMNRRGWESALLEEGATMDDQELNEEQYVLELFRAYRNMKMGGTNDSLAAAFALYEAFGKEFPGFAKPEERVKVLVFVTDGVGDAQTMGLLMRYLHGKSDTMPRWIAGQLDSIAPGAAERVEQRLREYRDQVFAIGIGITDNSYEEQAFLDVYNEAKRPDERSVRVYEDNNVAVVPAGRARELPQKILQVMKAKFGSPRFRALRARIGIDSRSRVKIKPAA